MASVERQLLLRKNNPNTDIPGEHRAREDMKAIFGPTPWYHFFNAPFGLLQLAPDEGDPRPRFGLTATGGRRSDDVLHVGMGDLREPGRAAGWAALRMYCDKRGLPLHPLWATDLDPTTAQAHLEFYKQVLTEHFEVDDPETEAVSPFRYRVSMHRTPEDTTEILIPNPNGGMLIEVMLDLSREYSRIRPELSSERISSMIGGLVGASSFEQFRDTWLDAYFDQPTPVDSARALLESGIFLSSPPAVEG